MENNLKPDGYYLDRYDRATIKELKEIERKFNISIAWKGFSKSKSRKQDVELLILYDCAVMRARIKDDVIAAWKKSDTYKDKLLEKTRLPQNIMCSHCLTEMYFDSHIFVGEGNNEKILFIYKCPKNHLPKKAVYHDGAEFITPRNRCKYCGFELKSKTTQRKGKLIVRDSCPACGKIEVYELNLNSPHNKPIKEAERQKYCTAFIGRNTLYDDLKQLGQLAEILDKNRNSNLLEKEYGVDKIMKLSIPNLESRLVKFTKELGFIKFQLKEPKMGQQIIVPFTIQDPSDRNEKESSKILLKNLKKNLFPTNWRVINTSISFRLGFISGQLKAYDSEDDLIKIGKEIKDYSSLR